MKSGDSRAAQAGKPKGVMVVRALGGIWYEFRLQFESRVANPAVSACSEHRPYAQDGVKAGAMAVVASELRF
jgi:hypothetical protein